MKPFPAALAPILALALALPSLLHAKSFDPSALDEVTYVETAQPGILLSGYVDAGYLYNFTSRSGGSVIQNRLNNDGTAGGRFSLHAAKLVLEKPLPDTNTWAGGFRADLMIGEDPRFLGQNVAGSDSFYLQQAFALLRLPFGNGIDLAVGKYQSLIGFEAEERPANLNITPGIVSRIDPGWLLGGYATYPVNEQVELALGLGNGNGIDGLGVNANPPGDFIAVTGFIEIKNPDGNAALQTGFYVAPNGDPGYLNPLDTPPLRRSNLAIWNTFGTWSPRFAQDKLLLAFNTSLAGFDNQRFTDGTLPANGGSTFFGLALYAKYQFNPLISLAGRAEMVHTDNDRLLQISGPAFDPASRNDLYSWTGTLGFNLADNLLLRLEYRADFGSDTVATGNGGAFSNTAHTLASQVVFSF